MPADLPDLPFIEDTLQTIAHSVNRQFQRSAEALIEVGVMLLKAKSEVGHGQFERLFADHANPIKEPLCFSSRYGQKFMMIAEHPELSKPEHRSLLPPAVTTLYALARLPASTVQQALTSGLINPDMQERDVRDVRLLGDPKAGRPTTEATAPKPDGAKEDPTALERIARRETTSGQVAKATPTPTTPPEATVTEATPTKTTAPKVYERWNDRAETEAATVLSHVESALESFKRLVKIVPTHVRRRHLRADYLPPQTRPVIRALRKQSTALAAMQRRVFGRKK